LQHWAQFALIPSSPIPTRAISATLERPFGDVIPAGTLRLGFGCGSLLAGRDRRRSLALLETALDCGVTYFDTARMYGEGRAEAILGALTPRIRRQIVLTTKAGILPTHRPLARRVVERGIRILRTGPSPLRARLHEPRPAEPRFGAFTIAELRKSIETSLRELRTDHIDILLLHECKPGDVATPETHDLLEDLKMQGKIRAYGIATTLDSALATATANRPLAQIIQIPSDFCDANVARLPSEGALVITHSCLGARFRQLVARMRADASLAAEWRRTTGLDPLDPSALARLLLSHALHSNRNGLVLFSSSKRENILASVQATRDPAVSAERLDALANAARELLQPT
jgi:D-threo-aldose 1-dehydrogenase